MSNFCVNFDDEVWIIINIRLLTIAHSKIHSPHGGGGGGSGGSVKLSACTLTAGSGAVIQANGGNGGQARRNGENMMCCLLTFLFKYFDISTRYTNSLM